MRRSVVCGLVAALVGGAVAVPAAPAAASGRFTGVYADSPRRMVAVDDEVVLSESDGALSITSTAGGVSHRIAMRPPTGQAFAVGRYAAGTWPATATKAYLHDSSCGSPDVTLDVLELTRAGDGTIATFAARYAGPCSTGRNYVDVRWRAETPWWGVRAPASQSFRSRVGVPVTVPITVTGVGPTVANLGAATLAPESATGYDVTADGCAGASLNAGDSCVVTVTFTPPVLGPVPAAEIFFVADSARGAVRVRLDGSGVLPPPPPSGVRAVAGYDGIGVVWSPPPATAHVPPVRAYRVYRDGGSEPVAEVTGTQYVDLAAPGTSHTYAVSAVADDAGEGALSGSVGATVPATAAEPGPVTVVAFDIAKGDAASTAVTTPAPVPGRLKLGLGDGRVDLTPESGAAWAPGTFGALVSAWSGDVGCYGNAQVTVGEARVHADGTPVVLAASIALPEHCGGTIAIRYASAVPIVAADTVPDAVHAPRTPPGAAAPPAVVTVANRGTETLTLGTAVAPPDWPVSADGCSGTFLAAGEACTLSVTFTPVVGGVRDGVLEIPDNTVRGHRRVRLLGTAAGVPNAPVHLVATPLVNRTTLTWSAPPGTYPAVDSYYVYRGTSPDSLSYVGQTGGTRYVDVAGKPGQKLYYGVSARNGYGEGAKAVADVVLPSRELHYSADTGSGVYHLYTRALPGGEAVRPLEGTVAEEDPAVSPDGRMLAYTKLVGDRYHLYVTSFDGKTAAKRGGDINGVAWTYSDPQWSPDGTKLAVGCAPASQAWYDICLVAPAGVTRIKNGAGARSPSWLPHGRELLVVTETSPRRVDILAANGSYRYLVPGTTDVRRVAVSPDGSRMAWTRYEAATAGSGSRVSLRVSALDGGPGKELVSTGFSTDPSWSPDSETIYYTYGLRRADGLVWRDVYSVASTGGTPVRLTDTPAIDEDDVVVNDLVSQRALPYLPRRLQDFTGDGRADVAIFRPGTGVWRIRGQAAVPYGRPGDYPVAADYTGDRKADMAVYRPSTQTWYVRGVPGSVRWGAPGDVPVPADYNGDGRTDIAVFRPSNGGWYVRGRAVVYGRPGSLPVPVDLTGDRRAEFLSYGPAPGLWSAPGYGTRTGYYGDLPVPDDYAGAGRAQFATYSPSINRWWVYGTGTTSYTVPPTTWGLPAYGNFDADRAIEPGVFEPTFGAWMLLGVPTVRWGATGDLPV